MLQFISKHKKSHIKMNYDLLWISYYIGAGLATYYIFKTDVKYILFAAISAELAYFIAFRTTWNFVKRYLFNLFYIMSYVTPLILS